MTARSELDSARTVVAQIDSSRAPEKTKADLMTVWSAVEAALRSEILPQLPLTSPQQHTGWCGRPADGQTAFVKVHRERVVVARPVHVELRARYLDDERTCVDEPSARRRSRYVERRVAVFDCDASAVLIRAGDASPSAVLQIDASAVREDQARRRTGRACR